MMPVEVEVQQVHEREQVPNVERAGCGVDPSVGGHGSRLDELFQSSVCAEASYIYIRDFYSHPAETLPVDKSVFLPTQSQSLPTPVPAAAAIVVLLSWSHLMPQNAVS